MIQLIGLVIVVYAIARLLQVPIAATPVQDEAKRAAVLWIVAGPAICAIAFLGAWILLSGVDSANIIRNLPSSK